MRAPIGAAVALISVLGAMWLALGSAADASTATDPPALAGAGSAVRVAGSPGPHAATMTKETNRPRELRMPHLRRTYVCRR